MAEAHSLIASYHMKVKHFGNSNEHANTKTFDELKMLRKQAYSQIIATFEKIVPQFELYVF